MRSETFLYKNRIIMDANVSHCLSVCFFCSFIIFLISCIIGFYGNYNKLTQWLKTTGLYFFTVLGARSPKSKCQPDCTLSGGLARIYFLLLPTSGDCWHSLACGCITLVSASIFTLPLPSPLCVSYKDTYHWI